MKVIKYILFSICIFILFLSSVILLSNKAFDQSAIFNILGILIIVQMILLLILSFYFKDALFESVKNLDNAFIEFKKKKQDAIDFLDAVKIIAFQKAGFTKKELDTQLEKIKNSDKKS